MSAPGRSRVAKLLETYYAIDEGNSTATATVDTDDIDGPHFAATPYVEKLLRTNPLSSLVQESNDLGLEIKKLDGDLQMLVYENYNKFISATDTIRTMKTNVEAVESELTVLSEYMKDINLSSQRITESLADSRSKIEELNESRALVNNLQFVFELPAKLTHAISMGAYAQAVRYYTIASPILEANSEIPSFESIREEAEDTIHQLRAQLREVMRTPAQLETDELGVVIELLLSLDEDDKNLRQVFVARYTETIQSQIKACQAKADDTAVQTVVDKLNKVGVDNIISFVTRYEELFLSSGKLTSKAAAKAKAQLEQTVDSFMDAYLDALDKQLKISAMAGTAVVSILQSIEQSVAQMAEALPVLTSLPTKYTKFAHGMIERRVADIAAKASTRFHDAMHEATDQAEAVFVKRSKKYGANDNGDKLLSILAQWLSSALETVTQLAQDANQILVSTNDDEGMHLLASRILANALVAFHTGFHSKIMATGGLQSLDPNFGALARDADPIEQHLLSLALAARVSVALLERGVFDPISNILDSFPSGVRKTVSETFSTPCLSDLWTKTSRALLQIYSRWTAQLCTRAIMTTNPWNMSSSSLQPSAAIDTMLNQCWTSHRDILRIFDIQCATPSLAQARMPMDEDRLCSIRGNGALIQKNIDRMFSRQNPSALPVSQMTPTVVVQCVALDVARSMAELVRMQARIELAVLHQIQVDVRCLRFGLHLLVDSCEAIDTVLDEVMMSASDRCLEPSPAEPSVTEAGVAGIKSKLVFLQVQ